MILRCLPIALLVAAIAYGVSCRHQAPRPATSPHVEEAYASLARLGPGDVVLVAVDVDPASRPELAPFVSLVMDAALSRHARLVTLSLWPHGAVLADGLLRERLAAHAARYGVDGLNLGFVEGRGAAVHLLGLPLERVTTRDYAGTRLAELPLAASITSLGDSVLVVSAASGTPGVYEWLVQGQGRFAKALLVGTTSLLGPELVPFFASGQLAGLVGGSRDVTALADMLMHDQRMNTADGPPSYVQQLQRQMAAQRWAHIALLLCLLIGQMIAMVRSRALAPPAKPSPEGHA